MDLPLPPLKSISDLQSQFPTEDDRKEILFQLRWHDGFRCPNCQFNSFKKIRHVFWCKNCRYQATVLAGTIFEHTRKPLSDWFQLVWLVTQNTEGISALGATKILDFGSYETAWGMLHKLRHAMTPPYQMLSGAVNMDELYIGRYWLAKNHIAFYKHALVLLFAQQRGDEIDSIRLKRIRYPTPGVVRRALQLNVTPESVIKTDAFYKLDRFKNVFDNYRHLKISNSYNVGKIPIPSCADIAKNLRRWSWNTIRNGFAVEHFDYYLKEFCFRFNNRHLITNGGIFYELLKQAVKTTPVPYNSINLKLRNQKSARI